MHRVAIPVLLALLAACASRSEPEKALHAYAAAVRNGQCENALELLSARTRYSLDVLRVKPQRPQVPLPVEEYYCNSLTFEDCKLDDMTLRSILDDKATVSMPCGRTQDSFLPGFSSVFLKYEPRDTELVSEDGQWKVVLPFVIRIVDVREREDQMREKALREQQGLIQRRPK